MDRYGPLCVSVDLGDPDGRVSYRRPDIVRNEFVDAASLPRLGLIVTLHVVP